MSNTIIMYENGKAVGGEGHPTNADEITFNNEDTDLVSEEVESAIKEVNAKFDKGSVSVTADGNKTLSTLLNELFALIEYDKVGLNTKFKIGAQLYHLSTMSNVLYRFGVTTVSGTNVAMYALSISARGSVSYATTISSNGTVYYNNESTTVPSTGSVLEVIY